MSRLAGCILSLLSIRHLWPVLVWNCAALALDGVVAYTSSGEHAGLSIALEQISGLAEARLYDVPSIALVVGDAGLASATLGTAVAHSDGDAVLGWSAVLTCLCLAYAAQRNFRRFWRTARARRAIRNARASRGGGAVELL